MCTVLLPPGVSSIAVKNDDDEDDDDDDDDTSNTSYKTLHFPTEF
jgi:hypothetical protein